MSIIRGVFTALLGGRADEARRDLTEAIGDERVILGPEPANYRGALAGHSKVKGNGELALTPTRLLFRKVVGGPVDVELATVTKLSTARTFAGSYVGGHEHLVLHTTTGDLAWFVRDLPRWRHAIESLIAR